jgi:hypothetical protein
MFRRSRLLSLLLLVGGVGLCFGSVFYLAKREPDFYHRAPDPDEFETRERAAELLTRVQDLKNDIRSRSEWGETFSAEELNCFFVEKMGRKGGLASLLPASVHSPRVAIDGDHLKIGFKYGEGFWSTVVWVELKVWLVKDEPNLVAVEVCDLRTGSLPVGSQSVLDSISESAREWNIEVTWYRNGSNPVGLFRFFANQVGQPNSQILTLEVKDGKIVVAGRSATDHSPVALLGGTP